MADRILYEAASSRPGVVVVGSICDIHSDASVLTTSTSDFGTWTKSGTGEYTLTLADKWAGHLAAHPAVEAATAVDLVAQIKSIDVAGAKTVVVNLNAGATPTDPLAVCKLHLTLVLKSRAGF